MRKIIIPFVPAKSMSLELYMHYHLTINMSKRIFDEVLICMLINYR